MFICAEMNRKELDCLYDIAKDHIDYGTLHESYEIVFESLCDNIQKMENDDFYLDFPFDKEYFFIFKDLEFCIDWDNIEKEDYPLAEKVVRKIESSLCQV